MVPKLDQVDLRLLRVFTNVVDCGGFAAAQIELGVGQSTISSHMADLEGKLGMRLCDRGRGGFRLTGNGRDVYEAAQRLFRSLETFTSDMEALRGRMVGELHLGTIDNIITNRHFRLSDAIARFKHRESAVRLNLHVGSPTTIERAVVDGRLQIGLGSYTNRAAGVEYISLFDEPQNLYCGRDHPLFEEAEQLADIQQLRNFEHVKRSYIPDSAYPFRELFNATAQTDNVEAIALLVLSSRFVGFLPTHCAEPWIRAGSMKAIRPDILHYSAQFELIVRRNRPPNSFVDAFIEDVMAVYRDEATAAE